MDTPVFGDDSMIGNTYDMVPANVLSHAYYYFLFAVCTNMYAFGPL
jgi:hypothetical protein